MRLKIANSLFTKESTRTIEVKLQQQGYPYISFQDYSLLIGKLVFVDV